MGSSLLLSPVRAPSYEEPVLEPGEIVDTDGQVSDEECNNDLNYRRNKWKYYVARSWPERLVLEDPPAPCLGPVQRPLRMEATLITDRVGKHLTTKDYTLYMQNNVAQDMWVLARMIGQRIVDVRFKYIFVQIGLDWSQNVKKNMVREAIKRLTFAITRENRDARIGILGTTPQFSRILDTKKNTVTFNRNLAAAVRDTCHPSIVQYLPLHLHFIDLEGDPIEPLGRYFSKEDEFTLAGGLVLRQFLFKEMRLIPCNQDF